MVSSLPSDVIKMVQFTDTHLNADPEARLYGVNTLSTCEAVFNHIVQAGDSMDLALATGDLVHDESEAGYAIFKNIIGTLGVPVYCMPGNHDDASIMYRVLEGERVQVLGDTDLGSWYLIFMDTTVHGQMGGELSGMELARLEQCLAMHSGQHALIALHHPPVNIGSLWMDRIGLANADELWEIVQRHPSVRGIVWGHAHQEYDAVWNGVRLLGTPSTCFQFMPLASECTLDTLSAGYRRLTLHPDGAIDTCVVRVGILDI